MAGSTTTTPPSQSGKAVGAAATVAADALTAQLLAKHSAGEKLTPSEYGKLGAWKAKLKGVVFGKPAVSPDQAKAPGDSLAVAPVDPGLVQRTTGAILKQFNSIARSYVVQAARKAGADEKTVARLDSAASLPPASQELMVEVSPDALASLGIDPTNCPLVAFVGALGLWGSNLVLAVHELKNIEREKRNEAAKEKPQESLVQARASGANAGNKTV